MTSIEAETWFEVWSAINAQQMSKQFHLFTDEEGPCSDEKRKYPNFCTQKHHYYFKTVVTR